MRHFRFVVLVLLGALAGGAAWFWTAQLLGPAGAIAGVWTGSVAAGLTALGVHWFWLTTTKPKSDDKDLGVLIEASTNSSSLYPHILENLRAFLKDGRSDGEEAPPVQQPRPAARAHTAETANSNDRVH